MTRQVFNLVHAAARSGAMGAILQAPDGYRVEIREPKRTEGQNDRFHAICTDMAKSGIHFAGKKRTAAQWKVLFVSGHAVATKEGADMLPGIEGEFVNLRESTALMSIKRGSSLIEYATAYAIDAGVRLNDSRYEMEIA